jgi:hypothetical protein
MGAVPPHILPDFVIIGAQKAGTTTIYRWLHEHPQVIAHAKEIGYFSEHYRRGPDWYRSHFPLEWTRNRYIAEHGRPMVTGEATPEYLLDPHTPARMARLIPEVKLIVSLRNPVDRAYSQFQMNRRRGLEPIASFSEALALEDPRFGAAGASGPVARADQSMSTWTHYLGRGHYAEALLRWFEVFPRESFCILALSDLAENPAGAAATLEGFLGLAPHRYESLQAHNNGAYAPLQGPLREALIEYFRPHNERLYDLLGRDFDWEGG